MSAVRYDNKRLIPAPFISISKEYQKEGHEKIGSLFSMSLQGKLVASKGSPTSSGTFFDDRVVGDSPDYTLGDTRPALYPEGELATVTNALSSFLTKEKAIRQLFATEGLRLEIEPIDSATEQVFVPGQNGTPLTPSGSLYCFPRINSISFSEGQWTDVVDYTVDLECDEIFGFVGGGLDAEDAYRTGSASGDYFVDNIGNKLYLSAASEDWALEFGDQPAGEGNAGFAPHQHTFRLSHNLSATGKKAYDANGLISEGWKQARRWVSPRLGLDNTFLHSGSGLNLNSDMFGYNHTRSENTNELDGTYSVNETWIISSGNAFEDFTIETATSAENGTTQVSINGTVTGLDTRDASFDMVKTKWDAAESKFNSINSAVIYSRASSYSGVTLNTSELSTSIGRNPVAGTISYAFTYDDRPSLCITNPVTSRESIVISDTNPHDVFATIPVIGRSVGPVLQNLNTVTESTRSLSIDITVAPVDACPAGGVCSDVAYTTKATCEAAAETWTTTGVTTILAASPGAPTGAGTVAEIVTAFEDSFAGYEYAFKNADTETWDPLTGKYTKNIGWTYQDC